MLHISEVLNNFMDAPWQVRLLVLILWLGAGLIALKMVTKVIGQSGPWILDFWKNL